MLKYLLIVATGYLAYKIVRNGIYLVYDSSKDAKQIEPASDLIQCASCETYVSRQISIPHGDLLFCSEQCAENYTNQH